MSNSTLPAAAANSANPTASLYTQAKDLLNGLAHYLGSGQAERDLQAAAHAAQVEIANSLGDVYEDLKALKQPADLEIAEHELGGTRTSVG
jgi:hypothetical protein